MDEKYTAAFMRQYLKMNHADNQERVTKAMWEAMDSVFSENDLHCFIYFPATNG